MKVRSHVVGRVGQVELHAHVDLRSGQIAAISGGGLPWLDQGEKADPGRLEARARQLREGYPGLLGVDPGSLRLEQAGASGPRPGQACGYELITQTLMQLL